MNSTELLGYIQQLPNTQRTIFNMYAIEGYSHKEIAQESVKLALMSAPMKEEERLFKNIEFIYS